jgi:predicted 3-demethylubiquinone-9 3-methyltransferase (glyoxalase superfamily)
VTQEERMARKVSTFLMFEGAAEQAMNLYLSLFGDAKVTQLERYGPGEDGAEGSVKRADFELSVHKLICFDSPIKHAFYFTPSISLFVDCEDEAELSAAFRRLSEGGEVLMPLDTYGFSRKFGWTKYGFGVSWQLNL